MAGSRFRGGLFALGSLLDGRVEPTDGIGLQYQGDGILDPRYTAANKDSQQIALFPGWLINPTVVVTDNLPSAAGTAKVAPAITAISGTALQFITACAGSSTPGVPSLAPGVAITPFQSTGTVSVLAIDFGFTTGTTAAGNVTVSSIPDTSQLYVGQRIVIGGAANAAKTASQICTVTSIPSSSVALVTPAPAATLTGAPIGSANAYGQFPQQLAATAAWPYWSSGEAVVLSPAEAICRGISISGSASATGGTFNIVGYDTYGVIMHESISHTGGAITFYSKKAYKYLVSVTPVQTDGHNYTVGVSDLYGFNLRSDHFENTEIWWNGSQLTGPTTSGFTSALQASAAPSSATAADVRGTIQTSTSGPSATGMSATASDGAIVRLTIQQTLPLWAVTAATPNNTVPLLGYTQF